jgi:hypothetical protein
LELMFGEFLYSSVPPCATCAFWALLAGKLRERSVLVVR